MESKKGVKEIGERRRGRTKGLLNKLSICGKYARRTHKGIGLWCGNTTIVKHVGGHGRRGGGIERERGSRMIYLQELRGRMGMETGLEEPGLRKNWRLLEREGWK